MHRRKAKEMPARKNSIRLAARKPEPDMPTCRSGFQRGFTLAELLIALAILGVIATFTIPKVLSSQQDGRYKAIAKETAAMGAEVLQNHKQKGLLTVSTGMQDLTQYMNYVKLDTTSQIDQINYNAGAYPCDATTRCLMLSNGAALNYNHGEPFSGTGALDSLQFTVDPDGKVTQSGSPVSGPGKSTTFFIYYNGRLTTYGSCAVGTTTSWNNAAALSCPQPGADPAYFSW